MKLCPKCKLPLVEGLVLKNSRCHGDRPGISGVSKISDGTTESCWKCPVCGYSETVENKVKVDPTAEWTDEDWKSFREFCEWGRETCK